MIPNMMELLAIAHRMSNHGVLIDLALREQKLKEYEGKIQELALKLGEGDNEKFPNSPAQLAKRIYDEIIPSLPKAEKKKVKPRGRGTGRPVLERLMDNSSLESPLFEFCENLLAYRKERDIAKFLKYPVDDDGRMRINWSPDGAETLRWSSSRSLLGSGANLQNIPPVVRGIFIAPEGFDFYCVDLSSAEFRIYATMAQEEELLRAFEEGRDVHAVSAKMLFPKELRDVKEDSSDWGDKDHPAYNLRRDSKTFRYANLYSLGRSPYVVQRSFRQSGKRISFAEAQSYIQRDRRAFPKLYQLEGWAEEILRKKRKITLPTGQTRMFFGRPGTELIKEFINWNCQGTVAWVINKAVIEVDRIFMGARELSGFTANLIIQCHDELVAEGESNAREISQILRDALERPVMVGGPYGEHELVIPSEARIGSSWGNTKEI